MAASLLAGIDWTDLDSAEMTTAVNVLCIAMQERFNIGAMKLDGTFSTTGTVLNPSDNVLKDMFPYKSNTPRWPLNDGDPLVDYTDSDRTADEDLVHLIQNAAQHYADIEKWDDAATDKDSGDTQFVLSGTADAPGTYDNRLLEVTGYTTYPDLSVMAPEEVKKLYDMVVVMKYVVRNYNPANISPPVTRVYNGEFDKNDGGFYNVDRADGGEGADYYGGTGAGTAIGTSGPYNDFKTGNSNLFGSTTATYTEPTDDGVGIFMPIDNYSIKFRRLSGGEYINFIKAYLTQHVTDWGDAISAVGFIGMPLAYKSQNIINEFKEEFPTGHDTNFVFPGTSTAENQRYYETTTSAAVGDVVTISRDNLMTGVDLPSTQSSIAAGEEVLVRAKTTSNLSVFVLEDWGGDGGFEYY